MSVHNAIPAHTRRSPQRRPLARAVILALAAGSSPAWAEPAAAATELDAVHVTAEQIARQALGSSVITAEDIEAHPPVNDLSEIIRTMPGINLTGNSASGQYGNNRQIDIRGMGPENTLFLVDGRAVGSRDSIKMGRSGERNTRGDSNWVPVEAVERIEVLRGPAAARYGSGASGGVVNIITKRPTGELGGSFNLFGMVPQEGKEGDGRRAGLQLSGPLGDALSFRLYASANKTGADDPDINAGAALDPDAPTPPAGREGVRNRDINGLLRWDINDAHVLELEAGFSRQGNIFTGEAPVWGSDLVNTLAEGGAETNRMYRSTTALTHRGRWDGGITSRLTVALEGTRNKRLQEGLFGGGEGTIDSDSEFYTARLDNADVSGELNLPFTTAGAEHVVTTGFEYSDSQLEDPFAVSGAATYLARFPDIDPATLDGRMDAQLAAVFVEDNIYLGERTILTPGLRYDHHSEFGGNASPSLNAQFKLTDEWLLKGGVARAFKAPNLYQSNPTYLYYTMGFGCPYQYSNRGQGCYVLGNGELEPETSINKEIGVEWAPDSGHHASLTWFHNDYKNRIATGLEELGVTADGRAGIFRWINASRAVVSGVEGNLKLPLLGDRGEVLGWNTNVTYMIENRNKQTDQPLSIVPEYTVNTSLDWKPTENFSLYLSATFYGEQEPPSRSINGTPQAGEALEVRDPYDVWNLGLRYRITPKISLGGGVDNLFDERLYRESNAITAGAATYNEPGRAYYVSMNVGF